MGASSHVRNEETFLIDKVGTNTMRGKLPSVFRARWAFIYLDISALKCLDILFFIVFDTALSLVFDVWVQNTPKLNILKVKSPLSILKIINIQVFIWILLQRCYLPNISIFKKISPPSPPSFPSYSYKENIKSKLYNQKFRWHAHHRNKQSYWQGPLWNPSQSFGFFFFF